MPVRRYLRISKYSVLEVKVYVTGANTSSWFNEDVLRQALSLARPLIFPKLREEREAKKKKQPTRDTINGSNFTGSLFLQDIETRHCILEVTKDLQFHEPSKAPVEDTFTDSSPLFVASQDEEEENLKPTLVNTYRGTSIYGKCLVLILQEYETGEKLRGDSSLQTWIQATQQESYV